MKIFYFKQTQFIPSDLDTVWNFFSSPRNLDKITPPHMNFEITHITGPDEMYAGQLISYKVSPFSFLRVKWVTEIKSVERKRFFIDEQKSGPFTLWYHQHFFSVKDGGVEMTDEISYAIPGWFFGSIINFFAVRRQLKNIFEFRKKQVEMIFPKPK